MIGTVGVALRRSSPPTGKVRVARETWSGVTDGPSVAAGTPVPASGPVTGCMSSSSRWPTTWRATEPGVMPPAWREAPDEMRSYRRGGGPALPADPDPPNAVKIVREYQRIVVFRLGRAIALRGPGLVVIIPIVDRVVYVDLRELYLEIPHQTGITRTTRRSP